jgi:hypothetical protein
MQSDDAFLRGLALWAVEPLVEQNSVSLVKALSNDNSGLTLYRDGHMAQCSVGQLAREALVAAKEMAFEI